MNDTWLTKAEAARYADVSRRTIQRWAADGRLAVFREGRVVRISRSSLEAFMRQDHAAIDRTSRAALTPKPARPGKRRTGYAADFALSPAAEDSSQTSTEFVTTDGRYRVAVYAEPDRGRTLVRVEDLARVAEGHEVGLIADGTVVARGRVSNGSLALTLPRSITPGTLHIEEAEGPSA